MIIEVNSGNKYTVVVSTPAQYSIVVTDNVRQGPRGYGVGNNGIAGQLLVSNGGYNTVWTNTSSITVNNSIYAYGKSEGSLSVNNALYINGNTVTDILNASANYVTSLNVVNTSQLSYNLANYALLSGATFNGNVAINANVILSGVVANGSIGSNGYTLTSNGAAVYWKSPIQRTNVSIFTDQLVPNTSQDLNISGYKTYILQKINSSVASRIRIYTDAVARSNDNSRDRYTDPSANSGLIAEFITGEYQTLATSPVVLGFNNDNPVSNIVYLSVTNYSESTANINVTMTLLELEE